MRNTGPTASDARFAAGTSIASEVFFVPSVSRTGPTTLNALYHPTGTRPITNLITEFAYTPHTESSLGATPGCRLNSRVQFPRSVSACRTGQPRHAHQDGITSVGYSVRGRRSEPSP